MFGQFFASLLTQLRGNLSKTDKGFSTSAMVPIARGPQAEQNLNVNVWFAAEPTVEPITGIALKGGYTARLDPPLQPPFGTGQGISREFSKVIPMATFPVGAMVLANTGMTLWGSQDNPLSGFPCETNPAGPFQMPLG